MKTNKQDNINDYIANYPQEVQALLEQMRSTIQKAAPNATESINYGIPTFSLHGNLVHFAAFKKHIGFYPGPSGIKNFMEELSGYKQAKGSVQFPLDKPLPLDLVGKIVAFRVEENLTKAALKRGKK